MTQRFNTLDVLRLEVEDDPTGLVNLVQNPNGELGGWGWVTPVAGSRMYAVGTDLVYDAGSGGSPVEARFHTEAMKVTAGEYVAARWVNALGSATPIYHRVSFEWLDSAGTVIDSSPQSGYHTNANSGEEFGYGPEIVPASAVAALLRFDLYASTSGGNPPGHVQMIFNGVTVAAAQTAGELADLSYLVPVSYRNILAPAHDIKVSREELNTGTLTATVLSATLDPSQGELIRPGRRCRLMVADGAGEWGPLFTGKLTKATVTYDYKDPTVPAEKRARIELTAVDSLADLANQKRPEGVALIDELPYVLEGCGVPWNVNGSGNQVPSATVVAYNENASAVDQVAITRDTNLGSAWVDVSGVVQVHDASSLERPEGPVVTPADYSDIGIDYDTERCINEVSIQFLRYNPGTLETEEVTYGPYRDETSIARWGVRSKTFTVQGIAEELADLADFAAAVLEANATPQVRVNTVNVPLETLEAKNRLASIDLGTLLPVLRPDGQTDGDRRVTTVDHQIAPTRWLVSFGFESEGSVASPQFTPSPQTGAGGKTIAQLLVPLGGMKMAYGLRSQVEAEHVGWFIMDGAPYDTAAWPRLHAYLSVMVAAGLHTDASVLPDMTDLFPVGAGTKAVGTSGGSPTVTLQGQNLPQGDGTGSNAFRVPRGHAVNPTDAEPVDILPPWRAVWFLIRAA